MEKKAVKRQWKNFFRESLLRLSLAFAALNTRIGLLLATRARFCAQQGTTNELSLKFDRKVSSLTAPSLRVEGKKRKKKKKTELGVPGDTSL